jgi:mono/diheme cytochrome c family protein
MKVTHAALILTVTAAVVLASVASTVAQPAPLKSKPVDAKLVSTGHDLFLTNCSPCHGAQAQGDDGPNLHHIGLPDDAISSTVTSGIKGEMPPFGKKLAGNDLKAVVAYIHSLQ